MTDKVKVILKSIIALSDAEKQELLKEVRRHDEKDYFQKSEQSKALNEEVRRILGPTSSFSCPVCGK